MTIIIDNPRPGVTHYCVRKPGQSQMKVCVEIGRCSTGGNPAVLVSLGAATQEFLDASRADEFARIVAGVLDQLPGVNQAQCAGEAWSVGLASIAKAM